MKEAKALTSHCEIYAHVYWPVSEWTEAKVEAGGVSSCQTVKVIKSQGAELGYYLMDRWETLTT